MAEVRVAIVDDHPIFCEGLVQVIAGYCHFRVTGVGTTAADAVELVCRDRPDVLILDLGIPGEGIAAIREVKRLHPRTRILVLTVSEHPQDVMDALHYGAAGYVLKGISGDELCQVVDRVANGFEHITPHLGARILASIGHMPAAVTEVETTLLSKREAEIYALIRRGCCNKEIGRLLSLSEKTVKHYLTNMFRKLDVCNRTQLAMHAQNAALQTRSCGYQRSDSAMSRLF